MYENEGHGYHRTDQFLAKHLGAELSDLTVHAAAVRLLAFATATGR